VLGVCRGVLQNEQDAEDAFQAAFLVLARKATTIRKQDSLGSWLHGVAYRVARKARGRAARRRAPADAPVRPAPAGPPEELAWRELNAALHEELARLPAHYRAPLVLCCREGASRDEAAQRLAWTLGRVKDRLERGRALLRQRLVRRGVMPPAALAAALLAPGNTPGAVPAALAAATVRGVVRGTAGAALSPRAVVLAQALVRPALAARLKAGAALVLALGLLAGGAAVTVRPGAEPGPSGPQPPEARPAEGDGGLGPRADLYGDPLPPGAVARLGSLQFRHAGGLLELTFSPDNKTLTSVGRDRTVRVWEVGTGKLNQTTRLAGPPGRANGYLALSPDRKRLACLDGGTVSVWDTDSGKELKRLSAPQGVYTVGYFFFSPDGRTLALGHDVLHMTLWDWQTGQGRQLTCPTRRQLVQGPDSSWQACFSPDGKLLAIGPCLLDPLCVWDVSAGMLLYQIDARAGVSDFSPDGKLLAVASLDPGGAEDKTVLRLYDAATGKEVRQVPLPGKGFTWWLTFSPDGKLIMPVDTEGISLLDAGTGRELRRLAGPRTGRQRAACFSPDGRLLASTGGDCIHLWDAATGKELHDRPANVGEVTAAAYSPDGRLLVTGGWVEPTLGVWDPATGRRVRLLERERENDYVRHLAFTADGRTLVVGRNEGNLDFLDAETGRLRRTVSFPAARGQKPDLFVQFRFYSLSPGGRQAITAERAFAPKDSTQVCVWDTAPVKVRASQTFPTIPGGGWAALGGRAAFLTDRGVLFVDGGTGLFRLLVPGTWRPPLVASPDGRLLAAQGKGRAVHVWEARTGKEVAMLPAGPVEYLRLARDCRTLVTADAASLRLWDLAAGRERHRIPFPADFAASAGGPFVQGLYLAPDGRRATTPLADNTLLVWDLPPRPRPAVVDAEAERLWTDLAAEDAARAYAAVRKLADAPGPALALLRRNLPPVAPADAERVRRLLRHLDSDRFAVREWASRELEAMGPVAAPALQEALAANPSAEARRRLEGLLNALTAGALPRETLRRLRALGVLEAVGSPEARQVLETVAGGAPLAPETGEARAALDRLARAP
jgi:RNA polymerase sigma factor (sigma-70 family)